MKKVVINRCYGGFGLSPEATLWLFEKGYDDKDFKFPLDKYYGKYSLVGEIKEHLKEWRNYLKGKPVGRTFLTVFTPDEKFVLSAREIKRDDPLLIKCVKELGSKKASGSCAELSIVEIPDDIEWSIEEYDGKEWVAESHRTFY